MSARASEGTRERNRVRERESERKGWRRRAKEELERRVRGGEGGVRRVERANERAGVY